MTLTLTTAAQGHAYIPVDYADKTNEGEGDAGPPGKLGKFAQAVPNLPKSLLLAVAVSPLIALGTRDITNASTGKEDAVLVSFRWLANAISC